MKMRIRLCWFFHFFCLILAAATAGREECLSVAERSAPHLYEGETVDVKLDVPYIPQNDAKSCATTSVAMVISYYEHLSTPLDKETVWNISGTDEATVKQYGNDMEGLQLIATHYGYQSKYIEHMEIQDVERFLSNGIPVMLNIKFKKQGSITHAILVVGYNRCKNIFYINDPANRQNSTLEYSDLEDRWSAELSSPRGMSHHSGFVVYPKAL